MDTKIGGSSHDVLRREVEEGLVRGILAGLYDAVFIATPCSSYSVRLGVQLRSKARPQGVYPLPCGWARYVEKHNAIAAVTARVMRACSAAHVPFGLENPADRSDDTSPAYWPAAADSGSLWRMREVEEALAEAHASRRVFAQCHHSLGGEAQKWTCIAATGALAAATAGLGDMLCEHGFAQHAVRLEGYDAQGRSRATAAAAYPRGLNVLLASALVAAGELFRAGVDGQGLAPAVHEAAPAGASRGGLVTAGRRLTSEVAHACEQARGVAASFSSLSNRRPAKPVDLRCEAFPGDLHSPVTSARPRGSCKARRRRPLPRGRRGRLDALAGCAECDPPAHTGPEQIAAQASAEAAAGTPAGPIHVSQLWLDGVYERDVLSWFALADLAVADIRSGRSPREVPTRTLGQELLQPWARGIVWDCRTPQDCRPVERSTRDTEVLGRALDRGAVRRVAAELGWHDSDIIDQIAEGGVETRADLELVTVLAFHHSSLVQEVDMAEESMRKHMAEHWVAPPTRDLPFVPCRLQPRGVVLQSRMRLSSDGELEEYQKPRITTDNSFGGVDSVNAGVPDGERAVRLPSVQTLGRGWGICQSAFDGQSAADGGGTPVGGYCVDAESAYSFCPVQRADLWSQCGVWWDADGRTGTAVELRMGFGGAFAPNRFERVSTFVAAYAQHLQRQFDAANPLPACGQRWQADRLALQERGELPPGPAQRELRFLQVYLDDFTGTAPADRVRPPAYVEHIRFDDVVMRLSGCSPVESDSRVHVHARIVVWALQQLGLAVSPQKCTVGTSVIALGMLFDGSARTISCPGSKRDGLVAVCERELALLQAEPPATSPRPSLRRFVGRLCSVTQVAPEIRSSMHGGYALCEAHWETARGGRERDCALTLRRGSPAFGAWHHLLVTARDALLAGASVALAPSLVFEGRSRAGCMTAQTDASGVDGLGGFAFVAGDPLRRVYVLSVAWPDDVRKALAASADVGQAALRASGADAAPSTSTVAAELFGMVLMPQLVARVARVTCAYCVGECEPAV